MNRPPPAQAIIWQLPSRHHAGLELLRSANQHQAVPTTHVQHPLVSTPRNGTNDAFPEPDSANPDATFWSLRSCRTLLSESCPEISFESRGDTIRVRGTRKEKRFLQQRQHDSGD